MSGGGGRWATPGALPRTTAEVYALLYINARPLATDEIIERLAISRGNASMCLKTLCEWGIVLRGHRRGERREYFESLSDVWEMFSIIAAERKKRELDPVLETIRQCQRMLDEAALGEGAKSEPVQATRRRLEGMRESTEVTNKIFTQFVTNSRPGLGRIAQLLLRAL